MKALRFLHKAWLLACGALIALPLLVRVLHFSSVSWPSSVESALGTLLQWHFQGSAMVASRTLVQLPLLVLFALFVAFRWRRVLVGAEDRWEVHPLVSAVAFGALASVSILLDLEPRLFEAILASVALLLFGYATKGLGSARRLRQLLALATVALLCLRAEAGLNRVATLLYLAPVLGMAVAAPGRWRIVDTLLVTLGFGVVVQLLIVLPTPLARAFTTELGRQIGSERIYSFCQATPASSAPERVYGVVASCDGGDAERCRDDFVAVIDPARGERLHALNLFNDRFHGRMLHALCLDDSLMVGMSFTFHRGRVRSENVLAVDLSKRGWHRLRMSVADPGVGHRMLYDRRNASVYHVGEYSATAQRRDLTNTGIERVRIGPPASLQERRFGPWLDPIDGSLQTEIDAISETRNSLYFAEWIGGSKLFEVDRDSLETRRILALNGGGTHSLAVDDDLSRVLYTSLWGLGAIDLETGRITHRVRTSVGPRLPVIDRTRDIVYLTTTQGNDLWAFDRHSLEPLGRLTIGAGGRNALLTRDARHYLVGTRDGYSVFDAAKLAAYFGR